MAKILFIICVAIATVALATEEKKYNCDYQFGDPSWNLTKEYYNVIHTVRRGSKHAETILPLDEGYMISYVCVTIPGVDKSTTKVAFSSLYHKVSVELADNAPKNIVYNVVAKRHGY
ncbi:uncharacterized protein LOC118281185 [Spodoptera frugiperda]|uniref:Uncharacterized protein LOC118281185 n=1 Tax=Spodoptera frugiperda TaxID=7108 RepID=A0A9R0E226_SPOFR|nr:uncharacterized protein LOC118281185 [Spodoptera frugiperda]